MRELTSKIEQAAQEEYCRAVERFGLNKSSHESYAVILEEYQEAKDESKKFKYDLHWFWESIKTNDRKRAQNIVAEMQNLALLAASEWAQVAAMCIKAQKVYECDEESEDNIDVG